MTAPQAGFTPRSRERSRPVPCAVSGVVFAILFGVMFVGAALALSSCGVVAVRKTPGPPRRFVYVDPHGRPRAHGGGVCPLQGRHEHGWAPTPSSEFVAEAGAWRDTRAIVAFPGPHALGGRRCGTVGWHRHAVPATAMTAPPAPPSSPVR
jgi:hypothetical protein